MLHVARGIESLLCDAYSCVPVESTALSSFKNEKLIFQLVNLDDRLAFMLKVLARLFSLKLQSHLEVRGTVYIFSCTGKPKN